jgi:hypothetical protein
MKFLFWNLKGNDAATWQDRKTNILKHLSRMVAHYQIDYLLLAESKLVPNDWSNFNLGNANSKFVIAENVNPRFQVLYRVASTDISWVYNTPDNRLSIWKVALAEKPFLLCLVHFPSHQFWDKESISEHAVEVINQIRLQETQFSHSLRTIIVGDFNMNPYDAGMLSSLKFAAVSARELAAKKRTVQQMEYRLFYNPMWSHFGDRSQGPPGTYFYKSAEHVNPGWHMLDQVLLSPEIMDELQDVQIIDSDGRETMSTEAGQPNGRRISDHFAVLFTLLS